MECREDISKHSINFNKRVPSLFWFSLSYFIAIGLHYSYSIGKYTTIISFLIISISLIYIILYIKYINRNKTNYYRKLYTPLFCATFFLLGVNSPKFDIENSQIPTLYNRLTQHYITKIHEKIGQHSQIITSKENCQGVLLAIIIGNKSKVSKDLVLAMRSTGAAHIMAVSGLHTGIVISFFSLLLYPLAKIRIGREIKFLTIIIIIIFYVHITLFTPSVIRASIIAFFMLLSKQVNRDTISLNLIAITAIIFLTINSNSINNIGFQLSFAAYLSIITIYSKIKDYGKLKGYLSDRTWKMCALSISCWFGTLPLTIYYFKKITPYFLLSNIVLIPLTTITAYLYFISAILHFAFKTDIYTLNKIIEILITSIILFAKEVQKLPFNQITLY